MNEEVLYSLGADYLELKEVRNHYDGLMKDISKKIATMMESEDLAAFKKETISISMTNTARTSITTFKTKLLECGVTADLIARAETEAKPKPQYSPRTSRLKNAVNGTTIIKKGTDQ